MHSNQDYIDNFKNYVQALVDAHCIKPKGDGLTGDIANHKKLPITVTVFSDELVKKANQNLSNIVDRRINKDDLKISFTEIIQQATIQFRGVSIK